MSFLFVDRILTLEPGKETTGFKKVTLKDKYLTPNANGKLALFPCVIGEALGQLCSWNVLKTCDFNFRPVGGVIQEIEMFADAYVGDMIFLESHIEKLDNEMVSFSGQASVDGKILLTVKNSLAPLLPLQEFNSLQQVKKDFNTLSQSDSTNNSLNDEVGIHDEIYKVGYDAILSAQPNQEIVAKKNISSTAPYFLTHFPNKPVFPLSLLMEYNIQLAHSLITNFAGRVLALRKVKIGNFIFPGDTLVTRVSLKKQIENRYFVHLHNEVDNKRICVAEVELG